MGDEYLDYLLSEVKKQPPWMVGQKEGVRLSRRGDVRVPFPRITTTPIGQVERFTLGEELIKRIELGEDPGEAFAKMLNKGARKPGATKEGVSRYLLRELEKAEEEGRL